MECRSRSLLGSVRASLQDSAWPVPWRVSDSDVTGAYESLMRSGTYAFGGDVWARQGSGVVRVSHSHEGWQKWFKGGNAVWAKGEFASLGLSVRSEVERWTEWVDIDRVVELPLKFQVMFEGGEYLVRWRLVNINGKAE